MGFQVHSGRIHPLLEKKTKTIEKMTTRVVLLKLQKMYSALQQKCFNMLIGSIPSFAPIQTNFPSLELKNFYQQIAKTCIKSNGLSKSDCKIRVFLPENIGGLGFVSTLERMDYFQLSENSKSSQKMKPWIRDSFVQELVH